MGLRALVASDLALILEWRNAPEIRRYMYTKHEISMQEHLAWFERLQCDPKSRWLIYSDSQEQPVGVASFTQHDSTGKIAFWGFYTAPNCVRGTGTGLGYEVVSYAFSELGLHKLNADVLADNVKSLSFHEMLGFKREGLFRDGHFNGEAYIDVARFGILEAEWSVKKVEILRRLGGMRDRAS